MHRTSNELKLNSVVNGRHHFQQIYYNDYAGTELITPMIITPAGDGLIIITQIDYYADDFSTAALLSCIGVDSARVIFKYSGVDYPSGHTYQSQYWPIFVGSQGHAVTIAPDLTDGGEPGLMEVRVSYQEI